MSFKGCGQTRIANIQRLFARHHDQIQTDKFFTMMTETLSRQSLQTISIYRPSGLLLGDCQSQPCAVLRRRNRRKNGEIGIS